ncbi:hypothetical protein EMCG_04582 [[Emmonsia] crescens]|uniref:Uncharacterized protein n=1 Tax=[Emmonsia] crescens TaxID=73230 RepID=A0A0G2J7B2_9EURO|nr:hypothetical protein EMCG_04582 [Emmonsia crescens UAMH 3008]
MTLTALLTLQALKSVSQTQQSKLRRSEDISKASERDAAEQFLKMSNRLQGLKPDSQLQEAFRLENVLIDTRTVMIIFKTCEKEN